MSEFRGVRGYAGTTSVTSSAPGDVALTVQAGDSTQTANLFEVKNSAGTVVASVSNAGASVGVSNRNMVTKAFNASSVDDWAFIADRAYQVMSIKAIYSVAGGSSAAVSVRKILAAGTTTAPGAAVGTNVKEFQSAAFDLTATANTPQTGTLVGTAADLLLAAGDKIGLDFSGTLTSLAGGNITIELKPV
jgi:hypothetical protein